MTINVLKLGGGAGVDQAAVLQNLAARIQSGEHWVLVHGASDAANRLGEEVGYPAQTLVTAGGHTSRRLFQGDDRADQMPLPAQR